MENEVLKLEYFKNDDYVYLETRDIIFSYGLEITGPDDKDKYVFKVINNKTKNVAFEATKEELIVLSKDNTNELANSDLLNIGIGVFLEATSVHYNKKNKSFLRKIFS